MKTLILMTAILIAFVNCGDESENEQTQIEQVITASNNLADGGTPTISDLRAIGLTEVRDHLQMPYEEGIAVENEKNRLITLEQLQTIITEVNKEKDISTLPFIGKWQLIDVRGSTGSGSTPPFEIEGIRTITFTENNSFQYTGNHFYINCGDEINTGVFKLTTPIDEQSNYIEITVTNCQENIYVWPPRDKYITSTKFIYLFSENGNLRLIPLCREPGCSLTYKKLLTNI